MATKFVGLDLGTHTVKVCEVVTTLRNFELVGFGSEIVDCSLETTPSFAQLAETAHTLLSRRGLLNEAIICSLPPGNSATLTLNLPFTQAKKIESVLPGELDDMIAVDIEDVVYDYQIIEKSDSGARLLCAYVRRDVLSDFLAALDEFNIDPKRVCLGPLSNFNLYDHLLGAETSYSVGVLDLGHSHTELIVYDEGKPVITRDFGIGGRAITEKIAQSFQVELDEAERGKLAEGQLAAVEEGKSLPPVNENGPPLVPGANPREALMHQACGTGLAPIVREIKQTISSHELSSGHAVQSIYITGGTSRLKGIDAYLSQALGLDVRELDPLRVSFNRLSVENEVLRPFMSKALALSVQPHARPPKDQINLRRDEFAYTGDFGRLRGQILSVAFAVVCMIVLGSFTAITKKRVLEAEHAQLKAQVIKLSQEILSVESEDVDLLLSTVSANKGKNEKSIPKASAFQVLSQVSEEISSDLKVDVNHFELSLASNKLQLRGKTGSGGDVERLVEALQRIKCLKQVKKERVEKSVDDRTKFRVSATSSCG